MPVPSRVGEPKQMTNRSDREEREHDMKVIRNMTLCR